jgi:hypothetical protein
MLAQSHPAFAGYQTHTTLPTMCGMRLARIVTTALASALVVVPAAHCSDVAGAGSDGGAGPGCPTVTDASGTDDALAEGGGTGNDGGDSAGDDAGDSPCKPPDTDGVLGGCYVFEATVDDDGFSPSILKTENNARVNLTLKNAGSKAHDFVVGCTSVDFPGCASTYCFPSGARIASIPPGGTATITFVTPYVEGIYDFRSDLPGDSDVASDGGVSGLWGQFVVQ